MAYDEKLAERIRDLLVAEPNVTEKKMFGGLGFMVNGNMAVAPLSTGGLMVRIDPADSEALVARTNAEPMEMRGRRMTGWLAIDTANLGRRTQLAAWVDRGVTYAKSLPPK
ncbi:TfoX/Sxy family protein [Aquihabitans sp. McL0605]|uniref:TfoX/Sxy family protein n=1 Tax=Aquihabitans sp. McL0605 TaxID=3415671 RepID=UPI003CF806CB